MTKLKWKAFLASLVSSLPSAITIGAILAVFFPVSIPIGLLLGTGALGAIAGGLPLTWLLCTALNAGTVDAGPLHSRLLFSTRIHLFSAVGAVACGAIMLSILLLTAPITLPTSVLFIAIGSALGAGLLVNILVNKAVAYVKKQMQASNKDNLEPSEPVESFKSEEEPEYSNKCSFSDSNGNSYARIQLKASNKNNRGRSECVESFESEEEDEKMHKQKHSSSLERNRNPKEDSVSEHSPSSRNNLA